MEPTRRSIPPSTAGVVASEVDAAARKVVERSKLPRGSRHRTGYHTGPNWGGRGNLSLEPESNDVLEAGMTFHMPSIAASFRAPVGLPCSSRTMVPPGGSGVLAVMPANFSAVEFANPM